MLEGAAYFQQHSYDQSVMCNQRAIALNPHFAGTCCARSSAQLTWSALTQLHRTLLPSAEAHGNLANALKAKGDLPMAIQFYVKVRASLPAF